MVLTPSFLSAFAQSQKAPILFVTFVRPYVRNISAALNRKISVKFDIGDFYVNCRENKNLDKIGGKKQLELYIIRFILAGEIKSLYKRSLRGNVGRLLGLTRMYEHYANTPLRYTIVDCLSCFH